MLEVFQIARAPDKASHRSLARDQSVNEMASDESCGPRD
jgi:hypothetical protein